jgi:copper resistance protein B
MRENANGPRWAAKPIAILYGVTAFFGTSLLFAQEQAAPPQSSSQHQHHHDESQSTGEHASASKHDNPTGDDDNSSETGHVPPGPPQHPIPEMPYKDMASMMQMDDTEWLGRALLDQFEWRNTRAGSAGEWEAEAWYGGDYNKLWFRTEGERVDNSMEGARAELFWDRIFSRWWSVQAGAREDFGSGPPRTWAGAGVQGLAPYWFDVEATFYVGEQGRTAARVKSEYDLLFTQRLILQPEGEVNLYGKADPERHLGSGVSDLELALRLRYEIRREFAPYVGLVWSRRFGATADRALAAGEDISELQFVAGVRAWF